LTHSWFQRSRWFYQSQLIMTIRFPPTWFSEHFS
jgi:hypothetical protein